MDIKNNISALWGLIIISSAAYSRPLYNYFLNFIQRELIVYFVGILIATAAAVVLILAIKKNYTVISTIQVIFACIILSCLFVTLELPEEKIHILLFGSLGAIRAVETRPNADILKTIFLY